MTVRDGMSRRRGARGRVNEDASRRPKPRRQPGRPKDEAKRAAIIDAARRLFFERGVEAVPIETIAAEAGVSKVTIYGHFGDKLGLFEAMVAREMSAMRGALAAPATPGLAVEDRLTAFGVALLSFLTSAEVARFDAMLGQEAERHPDLARRFFDAGPGKCRAMLSDVIAQAAEAGAIDPDDATLAAEDLLSLWQGMLPITRRLRLHDTPAPAAVEARVRRGVALFMRAHAPRTGA